jgi:hypothetical protein
VSRIECIRGLGDQMKRSIGTYEEIEELCSVEDARNVRATARL